MANGLFHKAIMESGVAIIPFMKAPVEERNEDVGILLATLQLPLLGQERMWSDVNRPCAWLSSPSMAKEPGAGPRGVCVLPQKENLAGPLALMHHWEGKLIKGPVLF